MHVGSVNLLTSAQLIRRWRVRVTNAVMYVCRRHWPTFPEEEKLLRTFLDKRERKARSFQCATLSFRLLAHLTQCTRVPRSGRRASGFAPGRTWRQIAVQMQVQPRKDFTGRHKSVTANVANSSVQESRTCALQRWFC